MEKGGDARPGVRQGGDCTGAAERSLLFPCAGQMCPVPFTNEAVPRRAPAGPLGSAGWDEDPGGGTGWLHSAQWLKSKR